MSIDITKAVLVDSFSVSGNTTSGTSGTSATTMKSILADSFSTYGYALSGGEYLSGTTPLTLYDLSSTFNDNEKNLNLFKINNSITDFLEYATTFVPAGYFPNDIIPFPMTEDEQYGFTGNGVILNDKIYFTLSTLDTNPNISGGGRLVEWNIYGNSATYMRLAAPRLNNIVELTPPILVNGEIFAGSNNLFNPGVDEVAIVKWNGIDSWIKVCDIPLGVGTEGGIYQLGVMNNKIYYAPEYFAEDLEMAWTYDLFELDPMTGISTKVIDHSSIMAGSGDEIPDHEYIQYFTTRNGRLFASGFIIGLFSWAPGEADWTQHTSASYGGQIFVVDGHIMTMTGDATLYMWDEMDTWVQQTTLAFGDYGHGAWNIIPPIIIVNDTIYTTGGYPFTTYKTVYKWTVGDSDWSILFTASNVWVASHSFEMMVLYNGVICACTHVGDFNAGLWVSNNPQRFVSIPPM